MHIINKQIQCSHISIQLASAAPMPISYLAHLLTRGGDGETPSKLITSYVVKQRSKVQILFI